MFRILLLSVALIAAPASAEAQSTVETRSQFSTELSKLILGAPAQFINLDAREGWRGVLLAPPGTALVPLITGDDLFAQRDLSVGKLLANASFVDRVALNQDGLLIRSDVLLSNVWEELIEKTYPESDAKAQSEAFADEEVKVLFQTPDEVDTVRGVSYQREPSIQMAKYREYEDLNRLLLIDDDVWKIHPSLATYSTKSAAQDAVQQEWSLYGYRQEIDGAIRRLEKAVRTDEFMQWSAFRHSYQSNLTRIDSYTSLPRTFFFPPPIEWLDMGSWLRAQFRAGDGHISCEIAKIDVIRPWMDLGRLSSGAVRVHGSKGYLLSDGTEPTFARLPNGRLPAFIEAIILAREISVSPETSEASARAHPLGSFVYPRSVNLVGFVIRTLPEYRGD